MGNSARLSQHFLEDEAARQAIVAAVRPAGRRVLEIGPGRGALSEPLLEGGAALTAVELDDRLCEGLRPLLGRGLRLIHADFLTLDLGRLGQGPYAVVSNLPYAVASPILRRLLDWSGWSEAVLMFQKEVALRVCAAPGGADYGLLSLAAQIKAEPEWLFELPPSAFRPPPRVTSGVIRLRRRAEPLVSSEEEPGFFRLAREAFAQRRKMAASSLSRALSRPRSEVERLLEGRGVSARARPQDIPLAVWIALSRERR